MNADPKDHMSNERTFLAWIRTSIGIMALGFVIEKFTLLKELISVQGDHEAILISPSLLYFDGYSHHLGSFLIGLATIVSFSAFFQFKRVTKEINNNSYFPSSFLNALVTIALVLIGLFLLIYLR